MIIEEREYAEHEYDDLAKVLLQIPDLDVAFENHRDAILNSSPHFFLNLFRAVSKFREAAAQSSDENVISHLDRLEAKLREHTNIIPADLPDSILKNIDLVKTLLGDNGKMLLTPYWDKFKASILTIANDNPEEIKLRFFEWCVNMLNMNLEKHDKKCDNPNCDTHQGYDRRRQFFEKQMKEFSNEQSNPISHSGIRLVDRKGAKIDFIRVINAMYELKFFTDQNGQILPKQTVMEAFGTFLEIDLSNYYKDLNQAFDTSKPEPNIRIFKQLEEVTKNKVLGVKTDSILSL